eukprot:6193414-Pleurochrysis_carterae.AAC.2
MRCDECACCRTRAKLGACSPPSSSTITSAPPGTAFAPRSARQRYSERRAKIAAKSRLRSGDCHGRLPSIYPLGSCVCQHTTASATTLLLV